MRGQVPLTSPCNQFPGTSPFVGTTIFVKKSSHRDQNLVPATCLAASNLFELKGPSKLWLSLCVNCSRDLL